MTRRSIPKLSAALEEFLLEREAAGLSPTTIADYRLKVGRFVAFAAARPPTLALVQEWIRELQQTPRHHGTQPGKLASISVQSYVRAVRAFLNWYCDRAGSPRLKLRLPKAEQRLLRPLSVAEVNALIAVNKTDTIYGTRNAAMLRLLLDTGIRAGELVNIRLSDVTFTDHGGTVYVLGKSRRERVAPFGKVTAQSLKRYVDHVRPEGETDHLFLSERTIGRPAGLPISTMAVYHIVKRAAAKAGMPDVYTHLLRHTYGTLQAASGTPLVNLRQAMGHRSVTTTERYLHLSQVNPITSLVDGVARPLRRGRSYIDR